VGLSVKASDGHQRLEYGRFRTLVPVSRLLTLARLAGADLKYIQKAMGHSSITVAGSLEDSTLADLHPPCPAVRRTARTKYGKGSLLSDSDLLK
jgi:hypothetical protein